MAFNKEEQEEKLRTLQISLKYHTYHPDPDWEKIESLKKEIDSIQKKLKRISNGQLAFFDYD